ncbi:MAG TPA: YetF domain-containing protein [Actinomycetota bacterium]|nr:YetF domain-containing protein [Actinomycetota bacterium]
MEIVLRAVAVFAFLWVLMRVIGKKELTQLSAFDLVLVVVIGDLVQQGVTQEDMSVTGAVLATGTIALLVVGMSYLGFRWKRSAKVIEGMPVIIVADGRLLPETMRVERLSDEEVVGEARQQGIADVTEIRYGVLEPDGRFSFVRFDREETPAVEEPPGR